MSDEPKILLELGKIKGTLASLHKEAGNARVRDEKIFEKLDDQNERISKVEVSLAQVPACQKKIDAVSNTQAKGLGALTVLTVVLTATGGASPLSVVGY